MGRPYSMDLRQRAMDRLASGETCHAVAAALKIAPSSVIKWAQRHRRTGSAAPGKMGEHRPHAIAGSHRDWVLSKIEGPDHVTLEILAVGLLERGLKVHPASISRFLHREGKSFKKNRSASRAEQAEAVASTRTMETPSGQNRPQPPCIH